MKELLQRPEQRSQRQSPAALTKKVEEAGSLIEPAVLFGKPNINFFLQRAGFWPNS
ncbi:MULTISPECIES: hypothetical protein [Bradyrhizobium]|uniref:hypothetical protein n=1 Tax=Bradyrhizobium TaxID=374 RepID=UPI0012EBBE85|nr:MULTISPECIES: hypothetical protein [Bradyrhizobium]MCA6116817.1 hypothetical protein [Bradyrhizobium hereditatis]